MMPLKTIHLSDTHILYKRMVRKKGKGAVFQWNSTPEYVIERRIGKIVTRVFKSLEEAEKEWIIVLLTS